MPAPFRTTSAEGNRFRWPGNGEKANRLFALSEANVGVMPALARTTLGLRITGDTREPAEMTRLSGVEPTGARRTGDMHRTASGRDVVARIGVWILDSGPSADLTTQIDALRTKLPSGTARPFSAIVGSRKNGPPVRSGARSDRRTGNRFG